MKKRLTKSIILALVILATMLICTIAIVGAAENKTYTVTYYSNGVVAKTVRVEAGGSHTMLKEPLLSTQTGKQLYGWYDETGKISNGLVIRNIDRDYTLYEAYGKAVKNEADFLNAVKQAGTYVRLGASITVDEVITLPSSGIAIIDLNGYNLTINSKDVAFSGKDSSIHIINSSTSGNGKIIHTGEASNADLMDSALFTLSPNLKRNAEIRLFKNANIETNVGLFDIVTDLTYSKYTYNFLVDSSVKSNFLVRTYGINNASFKVTPNAVLDVTGQYVFEDRGNCEGINLTFEMADGKLNIIENAFITNELLKYNVYLTGGSYNRDFSNLYPNYVFEADGNGRYNITECKHKDIVIGMTATCEEAGEITYKCSLCGVTYTEEADPTGHSVVKELAQEAITTKEVTEPGYYSTTCQRCGYEEREYFYPAPKDVYVTVKYRLSSGEVRTVRVKATSLFGDNVGERLQTFTTTYFEFEYGVKQAQIFSIELPLGVKTVAGGIGTDNTPKGLFYGNTHLEEIILPMSLENVEAYAFANFEKLNTIKGIEHITGKISSHAFEQKASTNLFVERMEINATTIESMAFYNITMLSLTFGKNLTSIGGSAFGLDSSLSTKLKEIFIDGNDKKAFNGATLNMYNSSVERFSSISSGHQFDTLGIVYVDHTFDIKTTAPTCQDKGFDFMKCTHCGEEKIDNYTDIIDHNYVTIDPPVKSTCSTQGYEGTQCKMCGDVRVSKYYPYDLDTHDFTFSSKYSIENICEYDYHIIGVCVCGASDPEPGNWKFQEATGRHVWDEQNYLEYVAPTCGEEGYKTFNCTHCGYEVSEIYRATGKHTFVTDNKNTIPATCKNEGKMVWVCDECGEIKERAVEKNPNNHEWEKDEKGNLVWTVKVAATADKAGTQQNKCTGCDEIQTKGIPVTSDETKGISTLLLVILIVVGSILVLGGVGLTLYFTIFKKSASSGYKYKFNTLNKK